MDLLTTDWPQSLSSSTNGPATVTLGDGLPIHDLLSIINKQLENMKTVMTSQIETITEMKLNQNENNEKNLKINERITNLENSDGMNKISLQLESHEKKIEELQNRPIIDPEQTLRLETVEKKLASFYGDDTNILGRVGYLENGRLTDQQSLASTMSQIKHLTDQINLLKRQQREQEMKNKSQGNESSSQDHPPHPHDTLLTPLEDQIKALQEEWNLTHPSFLKKEDLFKVKDFINFVANDLHKDVKGLRSIITQQQDEINLLKQQQTQQQQQPQTQAQRQQATPSLHSFDELSKRVLTLEIRMNHFLTSTPSLQPQSPSPMPSSAAAAAAASASLTESLKEQISEVLVKLDQVTGRCDDQRLTLEDLKRKTDLKLKQHKDDLLRNQETEADLLNQIQEIDRKTHQLDRKIQEISRVSPPSTPYLSTPMAMAPQQSQQIETPTKSMEQHLNHRLKTICDELQTSLQSIRKEMKTKHQDLELLIEKSFLPCEGCGGAMPAGGGFTSYLSSNQLDQTNLTPTPAAPSPATGTGTGTATGTGTGTLPLGGVINEDHPHTTAYTPSPSLLSQRLCSRRCPACLDRLGLTSLTTKEMMEKLNEVSEYLNKVNKKLKIQSDKVHTISDKQEKMTLLVDDLKEKVLNLIPKDLENLYEIKVNREDCASLIIEILRQYLPSVAGEGGGLSFGEGMNSNEIHELLKNIRHDFILLHTTTKDSFEEEIKKIIKKINSYENSLQSQSEEISSLSQLSEKIHHSLLTYVTNGRDGNPTQQQQQEQQQQQQQHQSREGVTEYFGFDPEIKMAIKDLKEKIEKVSGRVDGCEGNQQQTEDNLKKLRALVDTMREEMKSSFKEHTQQLQHLKSTHLSGKEIENRIQHSISHLDPQIFHKDRIFEMKDDLEKLKRYEKILEKKIMNQGDDLLEVIEEHKRITAEDQKRLESKLRSMTNEIQSHIENHPGAHLSMTGGGGGIGGGGTSGFVPSFPPSPLYNPHLSTSLGGGGNGGGIRQDDPHSNSSPKLRTYPDAFRNNVFQGSLSPQEVASPEFNDEIEKQNEFRDQIDFENYVRQTLNPLTEEKKKKKLNGSSSSTSSLPRPKSAHSSGKKTWNPRAYS